MRTILLLAFLALIAQAQELKLKKIINLNLVKGYTYLFYLPKDVTILDKNSINNLIHLNSINFNEDYFSLGLDEYTNSGTITININDKTQGIRKVILNINAVDNKNCKLEEKNVVCGNKRYPTTYFIKKNKETDFIEKLSTPERKVFILKEAFKRSNGKSFKKALLEYGGYAFFIKKSECSKDKIHYNDLCYNVEEK